MTGRPTAPKKQKRKPEVPARPLVLAPPKTGVFAQPSPRADSTLDRARRAAGARVEQAQRKLPARSVPAIPTLPTYTPSQASTAQRLVTRSRQQQVAVKPGQPGYSQALAAVDRELLQDPRSRARLAPVQRAGRQQADRLAEHLAMTQAPPPVVVSGVSMRAPGSDLAVLAAALQSGGAHRRPGEAATELLGRLTPGQVDRYLARAQRREDTRARGERIAAGRAMVGAHMLANRVTRGRPDTRVGIGPATINATALTRGILGATSLGSQSAENQFFKAGVGDLAALGAAPVVAGWEGTQALLEAAKSVPGVGSVVRAANGLPVVGQVIPEGSGTGRGQRFVEGVAQGLRHSVPGELLSGNPNAAAESFRQHPGFAALDLAGAAGVAGRLTGAAARGLGSTAEAGGARGAVARVGSTVRPPVALHDQPGSPYVRRDFSKDTGRKAAQAAADQAREPVRHPNGNIVYVQDRGRKVPLLKPLPHERGAVPGKASLGEQRADFLASRANSVERMAREQAGHQVETAGRSRGQRVRGQDRVGKTGQQIMSMVVEGTLRPPHAGRDFMADVDKRISRVQGRLAEHERLVQAGAPSIYHHADDVKKAQDELKALRKFKASPRAQAQVDALVGRSQAQGRSLNAAEAEANRLRTLEPDARRAALMPYAIAHMDARHHSVEDHAHLERRAAAVEQAARAKVDALPKGAARAQALADWRRARAERVAVSGKDPKAVHAHEGEQAHVTRTARAVERTGAEVAKLERARQRLSGRQSVQRGAESMRRMKTAAAAPTRARGVLAHIDQALADEPRLKAGARKEEQRAKVRAKVEQQLKVARGRHAAAKKAHADAKKAAATPAPKAAAALRTADGKHLPDNVIEQHMRDNGVDPATVAFLSHRELGNAAFHARFDPGSRPNLAGAETRTGAAYARGASGFGPDQVHAEAARKATRNAKAEQIDRMIHSEGIRHPAWAKHQAGEVLTAGERRVVDRGGYFTPHEAAQLVKKLKADTGKEYVAVRGFSGGLSRESQALVRGLQDPAAMERFPGQLLNDRILAVGDPRGVKRRQARNVVLVDGDTINRLQRHITPAGEIEKMAQALNGPFRISVLAQPRWLTGNFVEPYLIRLPAVGSGLVNVPGLLNDIRIATKGIRMMERSGDPATRAAAREIRAQQFGGLFIGGRGASVRRRAKDSTNRGARAAAFVRDLPVVKQLGDLLAAIPRSYFFANRQLIEQWAQRASWGRGLRKDMQDIHGSWIKAMVAMKPALEDALKGQVNTAAQHKFMRDQHELLGKYDGYGPITRKLIQTVAPFLPWALSAARFVYWTMPAHHTALTSTLLHAQQAFNDQWLAEHVDAPPGGLRLAARTPDGGYTDFARYTPYGLTGPVVNGDLQGITDQFFPQLSGPRAAIEGQDPFGRALQVPKDAAHPDGKPTGWDKFLIALNGLFESTAGPIPAQARRLQEHGETAFGNSTVFSPKTKPGTSHGMSAAARTYDPFRPTYLRGGSGPPAAGGGAGPALDAVDQHDVHQAIQEAVRQRLDPADLEEIRRAISGG